VPDINNLGKLLSLKGTSTDGVLTQFWHSLFMSCSA